MERKGGYSGIVIILLDVRCSESAALTLPPCIRNTAHRIVPLASRLPLLVPLSDGGNGPAVVGAHQNCFYVRL